MPKMTRRTFLWLTGGSRRGARHQSTAQTGQQTDSPGHPPGNIKPGEWALSPPPAANARPVAACTCGIGTAGSPRPRETRTSGQHGRACARGGSPRCRDSTIRTASDGRSVLDRRPKGRERDNVPGSRPWTPSARKLAAGGRAAVLSSLQTGALAEVMKGFAAAFGAGAASVLRSVQLRAAESCPPASSSACRSSPPTTSSAAISSSASPPISWKPGSRPCPSPPNSPTCTPIRAAARMNRMVYVGPAPLHDRSQCG